MFCYLSSADHQLSTPRTLIVFNLPDSQNYSPSNSQPEATDTSSCNRSTTHRHIRKVWMKQSPWDDTHSLSRTSIDFDYQKTFAKDRPGSYSCGWSCRPRYSRCLPQVLYGWRRFLLRLFGCAVGRGVLIRSTAEITYPWKVSIGAFSWIGDHVTLYSLGEIHIADNPYCL